MSKIRVSAISDFHMTFEEPRLLPTVDLMLIAGDWTQYGRRSEVEEVCRWFKRLDNAAKADRFILIAGNHEVCLDGEKEWIRDFIARKLGDRFVYLEHEATEFEGLKVFGSPYVPVYCRMGFNRSPLEREALWRQIPSDTDILMTHVPGLGVLDGVERIHWGPGNSFVEATGCPHLSERVRELKDLKLHVFGHIHEHGGEEWTSENGTIFYNACYLNPAKGGLVIPKVFEIETRESFSP